MRKFSSARTWTMPSHSNSAIGPAGEVYREAGTITEQRHALSMSMRLDDVRAATKNYLKGDAISNYPDIDLEKH
jgi:hypothetical protein